MRTLRQRCGSLKFIRNTIVFEGGAPLYRGAPFFHTGSFGSDQLIKLWASNVLQPVGAMPLIPHVVELRFVLNQGMAFSLLSGKQLFLIATTSVALLLVAYALFFRSRGKYLQQAALILVLGGGIGNLIDRVLNGEVVDYINLLFMRFAVFNFADICVCVGVALWVLVIFLEESHSGNADAPKEP